MYIGQAHTVLQGVLAKSENLFQWLLKRIDDYMNGALEPYIGGYKIRYTNP